MAPLKSNLERLLRHPASARSWPVAPVRGSRRELTFQNWLAWRGACFLAHTRAHTVGFWLICVVWLGPQVD